MSEITRNLSYNDIKLLKKNISNRGRSNLRQDLEQDYQKERQE